MAAWRRSTAGCTAPSACSAIKVLSSSLATNDSFVELFYREARLAAGLRHPNIVQLFDVALHNGQHYLVMELLEGQSLHEIVRNDAPILLTRVVHLVGQLAEALDHAHRRGIAHRDVKPANVFVGSSDHLHLVDFGIARRRRHPPDHHPGNRHAGVHGARAVRRAARRAGR